MPTRYYLVAPRSSATSAGSKQQGAWTAPSARSTPKLIAATHARYAAERDAAIPPGHTGPRPYGGVGGTRIGVKCLHAHVAHLLATGDDVVGTWTLEQIERSAGQQPYGQRTPTRDLGANPDPVA